MEGIKCKGNKIKKDVIVISIILLNRNLELLQIYFIYGGKSCLIKR